MREIKFKAKTIGNEWVFGNVSHLKKDFSTARKGHYISNSAGAPFAFMVRPETICQFTGLQDKNGVEIYEGDKCKVTFYNYVEKNTEIIMEVVFTEGGFALIKEGKITTECIMEDDRTFVPLYYSQKPNSIEVIGNIHTTHELLNPSN